MGQFDADLGGFEDLRREPPCRVGLLGGGGERQLAGEELEPEDTDRVDVRLHAHRRRVGMALGCQIRAIGNLVRLPHDRVGAALRGLRVLETGQHRPAVLRDQHGGRVQLAVCDQAAVRVGQAHQHVTDRPQLRVGGQRVCGPIQVQGEGVPRDVVVDGDEGVLVLVGEEVPHPNDVRMRGQLAERLVRDADPLLLLEPLGLRRVRIGSADGEPDGARPLHR